MYLQGEHNQCLILVEYMVNCFKFLILNNMKAYSLIAPKSFNINYTRLRKDDSIMIFILTVC